jgi:hypothetical protein
MPDTAALAATRPHPESCKAGMLSLRASAPASSAGTAALNHTVSDRLAARSFEEVLDFVLMNCIARLCGHIAQIYWLDTIFS